MPTKPPVMGCILSDPSNLTLGCTTHTNGKQYKWVASPSPQPVAIITSLSVNNEVLSPSWYQRTKAGSTLLLPDLQPYKEWNLFPGRAHVIWWQDTCPRGFWVSSYADAKGTTGWVHMISHISLLTITHAGTGLEDHTNGRLIQRNRNAWALRSCPIPRGLHCAVYLCWETAQIVY